MDPAEILFRLIGLAVLAIIAAPFLWAAVKMYRGIAKTASKPLHKPKRSTLVKS